MGINNQLRSVIQWENPDSSELFIKFTDRGKEIKNASKSVLQSGQGYIVTYQGKIESVLEAELISEEDYTTKKKAILDAMYFIQKQEKTNRIFLKIN